LGNSARGGIPSEQAGTVLGMDAFDLDAALAEHACPDYDSLGLPWRPMRPGERGLLAWAYVRTN
jgi:hypothetical protein